MGPKPTELATLVRAVHRAFGWRGMARRASYMASVRSGRLRRATPPGSFDESERAAWEHEFDLSGIRRAYADRDDAGELQASVLARAEQVLHGTQVLYGWAEVDVAWPPRWRTNAFSGHEYPAAHWTEISDDLPEAGDIKDVWELSRLPWTFLFARAWMLTGEDRWPEAWWQGIEDWARENPPNVGPNWRCGQESSLRAIAIQFGLSTFGSHVSTTAARRDLAERLLGATVARVRPTVAYALSQRNNHAISELVFLLTLQPRDRRLNRLLREVVDDQFYEDGSYAQQSLIYQRLAVHTLAWLLTVTPALPEPTRADVVQALADSREFMARSSDPVSGMAAGYGPDDGALLFPLDEAEHRDLRPVLGLLGHPGAPTPEAGLWLDLPTVRHAHSNAALAPSTYITLRSERAFLLSRVGHGRHRMAHADQGAIELWVDGVPVAIDPGTYRYTAPAPWGNPFTGQDVHNLPHGDGHGLTVGRFLSTPTPAAVLLRDAVTEEGRRVDVRIPMANGGYVDRSILWSELAVEVEDRAEACAPTVRWNLTPSSPCHVTLVPPGDPAPSTLDANDPMSGWSSFHYAERTPIEVREIALVGGQQLLTTFSIPA